MDRTITEENPAPGFDCDGSSQSAFYPIKRDPYEASEESSTWKSLDLSAARLLSKILSTERPIGETLQAAGGDPKILRDQETLIEAKRECAERFHKWAQEYISQRPRFFVKTTDQPE